MKGIVEETEDSFRLSVLIRGKLRVDSKKDVSLVSAQIHYL